MNYLYCALIGYFIGAVNPSYIISKLRGFDIRKKGSGNAGASNALIIFGKTVGALCAIIDVAKAFLAILLAQSLFPEFTHAFAVTAVACTLGHIFPFYMKFRGGKGLACIGGIILYYNWKVFLIMLACAVVIALIFDYICFIPICASVAFPVIYVLMTKDFVGMGILLILTVVVIIKHIENLKRIRLGKEMHISYLWKPKIELERVKQNLTEDRDDIEKHFSSKK